MESIKMTRGPSTSFIVRIWNDRESVAPILGEIEHVSTGEKHPFRDYASLQRLIDAWRRDRELVP
ncbi:MAG: hypothetical protein ACRDFX_01700 [Chloroflexota bacterium]